MKKKLLYSGAMLCTLALALWLTGLNYAIAYLYFMRSGEIYHRFINGDVTLPFEQAWVFAQDPRISNIIKLSIACTFVELAIIAAAVTLLVVNPWRVKMPDGGSRLAEYKDLKAAGLLGNKPGYSILLGTFGKEEVRYAGDSHFFVNGPSRSGKGRGFVMTNLLEWKGSAIVLDVKKENWELTARTRMMLGQQVFLFAPGSDTSHKWNPLDFVRPWPSRSTDLSNMAASLIPISDRETQRIWKETARNLLAGTIGYVLESPTMEKRRTLRSVLRLFSTGQSFSSVLIRILADEPDLPSFISDAFRQHLARDEEQRTSFEGNIVTALQPFNNALIAEATSHSDFDIRTLRSKPFSLYLAAPVSDFGTVEPILRLLIQQIHDVMLRNLPGKDEPYKCLLMLDEFYQFEQLPEIVKRAPLVAGYNLAIALIAQNIPQIDERYSVKTRDALLGNMDVQLYVAANDETTAEIVSKNIGQHYVERSGWNVGKGFSKRASQGRFELAPLMPASAVRRLEDNKTILQIRGHFSATLNKLNFYSDTKFIKLRTAADTLASKLPDPAIKLSQEWPLFETAPETDGAQEKRADFSTHPIHSTHPTDADYSAFEIKIEFAARAVYQDASAFMVIARQALFAIEDDPITFLLRTLREKPDFQELRKKNLMGSRPALKSIGQLRQTIITARRAILHDRAKAYGSNLEELTRLRNSFQTAPSLYIIDPDANSRSSPIENDLSTEVLQKLDAASPAIERLENIIQQEQRIRPEMDINTRAKLQTALSDIRSSLDLAASDELDDLTFNFE